MQKPPNEDNAHGDDDKSKNADIQSATPEEDPPEKREEGVDPPGQPEDSGSNEPAKEPGELGAALGGDGDNTTALGEDDDDEKQTLDELVAASKKDKVTMPRG